MAYSSSNFTPLHPWFVTGFSDAEGCFLISILRSNTTKSGWQIRARFEIGLHQKDKALLERIKSYFCNVGSSIYKHGTQGIQYRVQSVKYLAIIIKHFDKYPCLDTKTSWLSFI